jgi:hypothetical protein
MTTSTEEPRAAADFAPLPTEAQFDRSIGRAADATKIDPDFERLLEAPVGFVDVVEGVLVPRDMEGLFRMATLFYNANAIRSRRDISSQFDVFLVLQHGLALGLSPNQSINGIMVVNGRTSVWGDTALALVRKAEDFGGIEETLEGDPVSDDWTATCRIRRGDETIERTFSVREAKTAGLWNRDGVWSKYPGRMLAMRARLFAIRDLYSDVLSGLTIVEEAREAEETEPLVGRHTGVRRPTFAPEDVRGPEKDPAEDPATDDPPKEEPESDAGDAPLPDASSVEDPPPSEETAPTAPATSENGDKPSDSSDPAPKADNSAKKKTPRKTSKKAPSAAAKKAAEKRFVALARQVDRKVEISDEDALRAVDLVLADGSLGRDDLADVAIADGISKKIARMTPSEIKTLVE